MEIVLSNPERNRDTLTLPFQLNTDSITKRWALALEEILLGDFFLKKDFTFLGLPDSPLKMAFWVNRLNKEVRQINRYSKTGKWKYPFEITEIFRARELFKKGIYDPLPMFQLHRYFEDLQGQEWRVSKYWKTSDLRTQYAIYQLNDLCHQIEWYGRCKQQQSEDPESVSPAILGSYVTTPRFLFENEDWKHFSLADGFGKLFLKYMQRGKNHIEVFVEKDPKVTAKNINGLKTFTGQFSVDLGKGQSDTEKRKFKRELHQWLVSKKIDPRDRKLGLGRVQLGELEPRVFGKMKLPEIHHTLASYQNIHMIRMKIDSHWVSQTYPILLTDPNYDRIQMKNFYLDERRSKIVNIMSGIYEKKASYL